MNRSKWKSLLKKKLPLLVLFMGLGWVVYNFVSKKLPVEVVFEHRIRNFSPEKNYKLTGKITNMNKETIWKGKFQIKKKKFFHQVDLFSGEYFLSFTLKNSQKAKHIRKKIKIPPENIKLSYSF
ncbi:MAG: hypothetical protein ACQES9_06645 [Myxococcota bacterium]